MRRRGGSTGGDDTEGYDWGFNMTETYTYIEACAILRATTYGERCHVAGLKLIRHASRRHDAGWLREAVKQHTDDPQRWVARGIPMKLVDRRGV